MAIISFPLARKNTQSAKLQSEKCKVAKYSIAKSQSARHRSQRDTSYKYSCKCRYALWKKHCHNSNQKEMFLSDVVVEFLCDRGHRIGCKVTPVENTLKQVEAGSSKVLCSVECRDDRLYHGNTPSRNIA